MRVELRHLRTLVATLLLATAGAESWRGWFVRSATDGLRHLAHATNEIESARSEAQSLRIDGKELSAKELQMALLGARLSWLAYAESKWELESGLRSASSQQLDGTRLQLVKFAPQRASMPTPQWYLARNGTDLYLVFRGTHSLFDVLHDLMAVPEVGTEDDEFHGGFLHAVNDVAGAVREAVAAELRHGSGGAGGGDADGEDGGAGGAGAGAGGGYARLYLVGHSLGGALALTLLGAGLLPAPAELAGRPLPPVSVLTYGSPAAFHRRCRSRAVREAHVQAFVYGADLVPRLLGSPLPLLRQAAVPPSPAAAPPSAPPHPPPSPPPPPPPWPSPPAAATGRALRAE